MGNSQGKGGRGEERKGTHSVCSEIDAGCTNYTGTLPHGVLGTSIHCTAHCMYSHKACPGDFFLWSQRAPPSISSKETATTYYKLENANQKTPKIT
jgi:hypothetical protein